jgi:hypothetical protein
MKTREEGTNTKKEERSVLRKGEMMNAEVNHIHKRVENDEKKIEIRSVR